MFSTDTTRWLINTVFAAPTVAGVLDVHRAANALTVGAQPILPDAVAALGFSGCTLVVMGAVGIACNEIHEFWKKQDHSPVSVGPTLEDRLRAQREAEARAAIQPRVIPNMN